MSSLWKNEFSVLDIATPKGIISEQCSELSQLTGGTIIARISEYEGSIDDILSHIRISTERTGIEGIPFGEAAGVDQFAYEFYITSKHTPKYKYRVFIIKHSIPPYPVEFLLDKAVADNLKTDRQFFCDDEESFVTTLGEILNSKKITNVINSLLSLR